jgi:hypothetical protein
VFYEAEHLRKLGRTVAARRLVQAVIARLHVVVKQHPGNVELATILLDAYDLAAALAIERYGQDVVSVVEGLCRAMTALGQGSLAVIGRAVEARAAFRLADAYLVSNDAGLLARGLEAGRRCSRLSDDPNQQLHARRVQAAIARRIGQYQEVERLAGAIDDEVGKHSADPHSVSFVYQGLCTNLSPVPGYRREQGRRKLEASSASYDHSLPLFR